jgi:hypothetical protein
MMSIMSGFYFTPIISFESYSGNKTQTFDTNIYKYSVINQVTTMLHQKH